MDDKIITGFLEKGKLLTPEALEYLKNKNIENILVDEIPGVVVTKASIEKASEIRILKNLTCKKTELTADDFTNFYKLKYEALREIILQRIQRNFTSLNKTDGIRQEVHVAGIVRDIRTGDKTVIEMEDLTGTANVIIVGDVGDVQLDDVIAIRATSAGKILFGHQIIYPDIPLRRPVTGNGRACFVSDLNLNEAPKAEFEKFLQWLEKQDVGMLFVAGDIGEKDTFEELVSQYCAGKKTFVIPGELDREEAYPQLPLEFSEKNIISLSNPSMVEISGVKILLIHEMDFQMLKKRYMGRQKQIVHSDYLIMDEVPDIVHYGHSDEPRITNYKSVTVVNSGSLLTKFAPVMIDLSTREAIHETGWSKL